MSQWLDALSWLSRDFKPHVLITVVKVQGSAPRATGTKMVVSADATFDTIGGGNLEYQAIVRARALLAGAVAHTEQQTYILGNDLSQCCGGKVRVLFEVFPAPELHIALFGAGHVGQALGSILSRIDCRLNWFDSRQAYLPVTPESHNITPHLMSNPYAAVTSCGPGTCYLVMTHSHDSDFELVEAILSREDIAYCGLIASKSKALSFKQRLRRKGFSEHELSRLRAPVGVHPGTHKEPMAVAVSIAAELLEFSADLSAQGVGSHDVGEKI